MPHQTNHIAVALKPPGQPAQSNLGPSQQHGRSDNGQDTDKLT